MSTSLLYHAFGIWGYRYRRTDYEEGCVVFTIKQPREALRCPRCGSAHVEKRGGVTREWQAVPVGEQPVWVRMEVARVWCPRCRFIRQVRAPFADPQRQHTRAFARYVLELRRCTTVKDVARHLGVSDWLVSRRMAERVGTPWRSSSRCWSSRKMTSIVQCSEFSMPQWARIAWANSGAWGGRLLRYSRPRLADRLGDHRVRLQNRGGPPPETSRHALARTRHHRPLPSSHPFKKPARPLEPLLETHRLFLITNFQDEYTIGHRVSTLTCQARSADGE